jgi:hypothetical protein
MLRAPSLCLLDTTLQAKAIDSRSKIQKVEEKVLMLSLMKHPPITFSFQSLYTLYCAITSGNIASSNTHRSNTTIYNRSSGSNATPDNGMNATSNSGSIKISYRKNNTISQFQTRIHNTINIHNSYVGLMQSCQELRLEPQTLKEAFKSLNVSSWKVTMDE